MLSLNYVVMDALKTVGVKMFYYYPASWITLPCMAWRESSNRELARADGREQLAEIVYTIDIWSDSAEENSSIGARVDALMTQAGFRRSYCADHYEPTARLHHRIIRYRAVAGADGRIYQ